MEHLRPLLSPANEGEAGKQSGNNFPRFDNTNDALFVSVAHFAKLFFRLFKGFRLGREMFSIVLKITRTFV
jgi:hypothetical protein